MIRSMTAFAGGESELNGLTINCEIRSVNHRYCDISLKIPDNFRFAEPQIRSMLGARLKRGKIECALNCKNPNVEEKFIVDINAVKGLLSTTTNIEQLMTNPQPFSALDILAFPGIQQENALDRSLLLTAINELLERTLTKLLAAREQEGKQLSQLIEERCQKIFLLIKAAEQCLPEVLLKLREKLYLRINDLKAEPDFDRLEQELVILTQKLDVDEELDRLQSHTREVLLILKQKGPIGRRLDFMMQEMNREANTLGSKSADKEMTKISIDLKVLIEQMREQIQNIE